MKETTCGWCGEPITSKHRRKFCSDTCGKRAAEARQRAQKDRLVICDACGREFDLPECHGRPRNCSPACMRESKRRRYLEWCGRAREAQLRALGPRHCLQCSAELPRNSRCDKRYCDGKCKRRAQWQQVLLNRAAAAP